MLGAIGALPRLDMFAAAANPVTVTPSLFCPIVLDVPALELAPTSLLRLPNDVWGEIANCLQRVDALNLCTTSTQTVQAVDRSIKTLRVSEGRAATMLSLLGASSRFNHVNTLR